MRSWIFSQAILSRLGVSVLKSIHLAADGYSSKAQSVKLAGSKPPVPGIGDSFSK
jgi:hypothetical protein